MSDPIERSIPESTAPLSSSALARRHMLLKSLGKGTAVVAVASVPMRTLANMPTLKTIDGTRCSLSGMMSGNHSRMGTATATCVGQPPDHWGNPKHWNHLQKKFAHVKFRTLFSDHGNERGKYTLFEFLCGQTAGPVVGKDKDDKGEHKGKNQADHDDDRDGMGKLPTLPFGVVLKHTDEWYWCCAWMNAAANHDRGSGVIDYPYTPAQVVAMYQHPRRFHNVTREQALSFFKKTWGA